MCTPMHPRYWFAVVAALLAACASASSAPALKARDAAYGPAAAQKLDVYAATATVRDAPILLMVHGGGWRRGDKDARTVVEHKQAHFGARGYLLVSVDYRLLPDADPLAQAADIARALAFVQQHAADWGGDGRRVVLVGHSAGAHLVALLASAPSLTQAQGAQPWLGTIALDSAAYDVPAIMQARHLRLYDRAFGEDPAFWARASPQQQLQRAPAPMLLVCSTRRDDACSQARRFKARIDTLGGRAELLPEDLSHRQINDTLGEAGAYTAAVDSFLQSLGLP